MLVAAALVLTGCAGGAGWPGSAPAVQQSPNSESGPAAVETPAPGDDAPESSASTAPRPVVDSCDWDAAALVGSPSDAASGQHGALRDVIAGSWQHTHFDAGQGFEALGQDIRYVFPSDDEILYCQHVPGVTDHAENRASITWEDTTIVLPGGAVRFTVTDWSESSMLWLNHLDNSTYLLVRR